MFIGDGQISMRNRCICLLSAFFHPWDNAAIVMGNEGDDASVPRSRERTLHRRVGGHGCPSSDRSSARITYHIRVRVREACNVPSPPADNGIGWRRE